MIADDIRVRQTFSLDGYKFEILPEEKTVVEQIDAEGGFEQELTESNLEDMLGAIVGLPDDALISGKNSLHDLSTKIKETYLPPGKIKDLHEHGLIGEENRDLPMTNILEARQSLEASIARATALQPTPRLRAADYYKMALNQHMVPKVSKYGSEFRSHNESSYIATLGSTFNRS